MSHSPAAEGCAVSKSAGLFSGHAFDVRSIGHCRITASSGYYQTAVFAAGGLGRKEIAEQRNIFQRGYSGLAHRTLFFGKTSDDETAAAMGQAHGLGDNVFT